jgi:hypothetical protein
MGVSIDLSFLESEQAMETRVPVHDTELKPSVIGPSKAQLIRADSLYEAISFGRPCYKVGTPLSASRVSRRQIVPDRLLFWYISLVSRLLCSSGVGRFSVERGGGRERGRNMGGSQPGRSFDRYAVDEASM